MQQDSDEKVKEQDSEVMLRFPIPQSLHDDINRARGKIMTSEGRDIPMYEALRLLLIAGVKATMQ